MTKIVGAVLTFVLAYCSLYCNVIINEFLYDPVGTDTGFEWIELYNNGNLDINLEGAGIQVAGSSFTTVFTFPHYILRAHRFVLIGEANITQAVFITPLVMQNGGDATDGVGFISADGSYTDTVLYDSPNTNGLLNDYDVPGVSFVPDVSAGYSLARIVDGLDTHNCEADFIGELNPTPGLPNNVPVDYALGETEVSYIDQIYTLNTDIWNYSLADNDTITINMQVSLNNQLLQSFDIQPFASGTSLHFSTPLNVSNLSVGILSVELVLYNDVNPANNLWTTQLGDSLFFDLSINEIMYNPETDSQEWIELYIPPWVCDLREVTITDAAENSVQITLNSLCVEYLVLCRDASLLLTKYPNCPAYNVLQVSSLPALNNDGDIIIIKDNYGITIDSMSYVGVSNKKDISLERQLNADSTVTWHYCLDEAKATPGQHNSIVPPLPPIESGHVKLNSSTFNPLIGESMHLQYNFRDTSNTINCSVYDLKGNKRFTIASDKSIGSSGELIWNGRDNQGKALPRGLYILLVEAKDSTNRYFLRKQLTVVLATK